MTVETSRAGESSFGSLGLWRRQRFTQRIGNNLARGKFPVAQIGKQILQLRASVFGGDAQQFSLGNFLQAAAHLARFALEQSPAHFGRLAALDEVDVVADLAARARSAHEIQPIPAGDVALLRQNFDDVAVGEACRSGTICPFTFAPMH